MVPYIDKVIVTQEFAAFRKFLVHPTQADGQCLVSLPRLFG